MDQRTYELIAQFISDKTGIQINFEIGATPSACIEERRITLPLDIKDENVFAALAVTMHEAGHIQHTIFDAEYLCRKDMNRFEILNSVEDIRIDNKNFNLLPNVKSFYEKLYQRVSCTKNSDFLKQPLHRRVLCRLILTTLRMGGYIGKDPEAVELIRDNSLDSMVIHLHDYLDSLEYWTRNKGQEARRKEVADKARDKIDEIHAVLFPKQQQPDKGDSNDNGDSDNEEDDDDSKDKGQTDSKDGDGQASSGDPQDGDKEQESAGGEREFGASEIDKILKKGGGVIFAQSKTTSSGRGCSAVGEASLKATTKAHFTELLNQKMVKQVDDGVQLNTDSLLNYHIGDVEALFTEEKVVKRKKSKIVLMLDCSGSMNSRMMDGKERWTSVKSMGKALERVLNEVKSLEGINVDYEIWSFDDDARKLNRIEDYQIMGCTDINQAYRKAEKSLTACDVEGERILVFATDGDVSKYQTDQMRQDIMRSGSNIKALMIGIGSNINGDFVKDIVGNQNILVGKHADIILMETITKLL